MNKVLEELYSLPVTCPKGVDVWAASMVETKCGLFAYSLNKHWVACDDATKEAIAAALAISGPDNVLTPLWKELPAALRQQYLNMNAAVNEVLA